MKVVNLINSILILVVFLHLSCFAQTENFIYKSINNNKSIFLFKKDKEYKSVVNYLPKKYVTDGSVDYTIYIQKAIDENTNLIFPNFPIMINDNGLNLKSNTNIYFQEKSSVVMKPSSKTKFSIFYLKNVNNINIYNPTLIGDRTTHLETKGEWGMGISIYGSTNINIYNVNIKDTWGDGIYINAQKEKQSNNVLVKNGQIDNARRNGISIISGKNITIDNLLVSNTNGTKPASGIDIEPNHPTNILDNITLKDIKTFNNQNEGILLVLTRIGNPNFNKKVTINITNHIDEGSNYAMRFGSGFRKNDKPLTGEIKIENSKWSNYRNDGIIKITGNLNSLPKVSFKNIKVEKKGIVNFNKHLNRIQKNNKQFQIVK